MVENKSTNEDLKKAEIDRAASAYEQIFNIIVCFPDGGDDEVKIMTTANKKVISIFDAIFAEMPHRKNYLLSVEEPRNKGTFVKNSEQSINIETVDTFLSPLIDESVKTEKIIDVKINAKFEIFSKVNIQLFLTTPADEKSKKHIVTSIEKFLNTNKNFSGYAIEYNSSYSKVAKQEKDQLVIGVDEALMDVIIPAENDSADIFLILGNSKSPKIQSMKKQYPKVKLIADKLLLLFSARSFT